MPDNGLAVRMMMATMKTERFTAFFNRLMKEEGGLADDPDDTGGLTKYGISHKAYPHLNIRTLTREQAMDIYYRDYYNAVSGDLINDSRLAYAVFDTAVNCGIGTAGKILQSAVNGLFDEDLTVDGRIGVRTVTAVNGNNASLLLFLFCSLRAQHYMGIIDKYPSNRKFMNGWIRRTRRCLLEEI